MTQEQKWLAYVAKIRNEHEEEITRLKAENKQSKEDYDKIKKLEFAAQQLSEYKEVIKELLPLAIAYSMHLEGLGNYESLNKGIASSIYRAKKLIDK